MNRKVKRAWFVGALALGISAMIPQDASAQLFRGRRAAMNRCAPVVYTPPVVQGAYYGQSGMACGSGTYARRQPSMCCETTPSSGSYSPEVYGATSQENQESYDAQGNRIEAGTPWNDQERFDSQGNRIDRANQWNRQQRFDARGNRIDGANQFNSQQRFDAQGNRIDGGVPLNGQQRLDVQGNRNAVGGQLDGQQPVDPQGNRSEEGIRSNQGVNVPNTKTDPSGVPGSTDEGTNPPTPRDR